MNMIIEETIGDGGFYVGISSRTKPDTWPMITKRELSAKLLDKLASMQ